MLSSGIFFSASGCSFCLCGQVAVSLLKMEVGLVAGLWGNRMIPLPAKDPVRGFEMEFSWTKLWAQRHHKESMAGEAACPELCSGVIACDQPECPGGRHSDLYHFPPPTHLPTSQLSDSSLRELLRSWGADRQRQPTGRSLVSMCPVPNNTFSARFQNGVVTLTCFLWFLG